MEYRTRRELPETVLERLYRLTREEEEKIGRELEEMELSERERLEREIIYELEGDARVSELGRIYNKTGEETEDSSIERLREILKELDGEIGPLYEEIEKMKRERKDIPDGVLERYNNLVIVRNRARDKIDELSG
jgi:hypothetical protein